MRTRPPSSSPAASTCAVWRAPTTLACYPPTKRNACVVLSLGPPFTMGIPEKTISAREEEKKREDKEGGKEKLTCPTPS